MFFFLFSVPFHLTASFHTSSHRGPESGDVAVHVTVIISLQTEMKDTDGRGADSSLSSSATTLDTVWGRRVSILDTNVCSRKQEAALMVHSVILTPKNTH